ncbi:hypothetical protein PG999_013490 [Apiospora kogelbergensis]|uniref:chitinase n=1 Tax=Apiospora kogelbergensis TaxID=1337665 RepID=A0AAW0Q5I1_9PEZI
MRGVSIWAASARVVVLGGLIVGGAAARGQKRDECSLTFVTTVLMPTTVYVTVSASPSSLSMSSRSVSSGTSSGVESSSGAPSGGSGTTSFSVTLGTSSSIINEPSTTASESGGVTSGTSSTGSETITTPITDPLTSISATSGTISSSITSGAPGSPTIKPPGPPSPPPIFRGFKNAVYFTSWGTSGNNSYLPQELPVSELTHILYAFADIDANGTVKSSDAFADVGKRYAHDPQGNRTLGHNAYGAVKQLYLHKKYNRNLKTLLSVGGFDFSPKFVPVAADEGRRRVFAASAVKMMADYGFDGIDLDWEYPANAEQGQHFVLLLKACREALDKFSFQHRLPYRFLLTVATPAGPVNSHKLDLVGMDPYVDMWNLMAYDYTGSWDNTTGHQSNLYRSPRYPSATKLSTDDAVQYYESLGIQSSKILLGVPTYGRSFESTSGLGQAYAGGGGRGRRRAVVQDASPARRPRDVGRRGQGVVELQQSDARARELRHAPKHLVQSETLDWLDESPNHLWYPMSQYDNIRWGMPGV